MQIEGYCLKCKVKRELSNARVVTLKNGRPAAKGNCPVCGRVAMTFLSAKKASAWQQLDKRGVEKNRKEDVKKKMESIRVVHSIPGRVRLKLSPESPKPNLDDVLQIDGVEKARFSKIARSLLIIYDAKMSLEDLLSGIEEKLPQLSWSTTTGQMRVVREEEAITEETEEEEIAKEVEEQETAEEAEEQETAEEAEEEEEEEETVEEAEED